MSPPTTSFPILILFPSHPITSPPARGSQTCPDQVKPRCPGTFYSCSCATCYGCSTSGAACNCVNCGCYSKCPGTGPCIAATTAAPATTTTTGITTAQGTYHPTSPHLHLLDFALFSPTLQTKVTCTVVKIDECGINTHTHTHTHICG